MTKREKQKGRDSKESLKWKIIHPTRQSLVTEWQPSTGQVATSDPMIDKGLKYIEGLVNDKAGHMAGADPKMQLQNYVTCVNVMALAAANSQLSFGSIS